MKVEIDRKDLLSALGAVEEVVSELEGVQAEKDHLCEMQDLADRIRIVLDLPRPARGLSNVVDAVGSFLWTIADAKEEFCRTCDRVQFTYAVPRGTGAHRVFCCVCSGLIREARNA